MLFNQDNIQLDDLLKVLIDDEENKKINNLFDIKNNKNFEEELKNFLNTQLNEVKLEESTGDENSSKTIKKEKDYS